MRHTGSQLSEKLSACVETSDNTIGHASKNVTYVGK